MAISKALLTTMACIGDVHAQPSLRGSVPDESTAPAVETEQIIPQHLVVPSDASKAAEDELWVHAGHTGVSVGGAHVGHTGVVWHRPGTGYHHIGHTGASWGHPYMLWGHVGHTGANWGGSGGHVGHTGANWGAGGGHVGHTGASWGHPWMLNEKPEAVNVDSTEDQTEELWGHVGHTGANWGGSGGHVGHTGASWGHPWMYQEKEVAESVNVDAAETEELWGHVGHTGATWGSGRGHVGHTGASWGHPWMYDEKQVDVNQNQTEELWGHVGHTGASWGRGGGHVGHTGASWGHPWLFDEKANGTNADFVDKFAEEDNSTESFWAHIGHTGARWGRGPYGGRYGHIGHTGATWGHPWLLDATEDSAEHSDMNPPDADDMGNSFWVHVGHTGARWGRYGSGGHVGHTGATWGHPWMLNAAEPTNDASADATEEDFMPKPDQEFWVHIQPGGATVGLGGVNVGHVGSSWGRPMVIEQYDEADSNTADKEGVDAGKESPTTPQDFWLHVGPTGASMGMGAIRVAHTGETFGQPNEL